ncbi:MAG: hypothetical protein ACOYVD_15965 [Bacillota bacterium]
MYAFHVKLVDTNGVVSPDKVFYDKVEAENYVTEKEKSSTGWELQIFTYPVENLNI